jgi:hypothetical protein
VGSLYLHVVVLVVDAGQVLLQLLQLTVAVIGQLPVLLQLAVHLLELEGETRGVQGQHGPQIRELRVLRINIDPRDNYGYGTFLLLMVMVPHTLLASPQTL